MRTTPTISARPSAPTALTTLLAPALAPALALALTGCAIPTAEGGDEAGATPSRLAFSYVDRAEPGYLDQTLTLSNGGGTAAAPELRFTALDAAGDPLPEVSVSSVFGSDEGLVVVPAFTEVIDLLKFRGPGREEAVDVEVDVVSPHELTEEVPPANDLAVRRYDVTGRVRQTGLVDVVKVKNPYEQALTVRLVGLEFTRPRDGVTQQVRRVSRLSGAEVVEPGRALKVSPPRRFRTQFFDSVKVYLSVPDA